MPVVDCDGGCKSYVAARIEDHQHQHVAEEAALRAATEAMAARLDAMNEFRAQLVNQAGTFVTRSTLDALLLAQGVKIDGLERAASRVAALTGTAAGVLGIVGGAIIVLLVNHV